MQLDPNVFSTQDASWSGWEEVVKSISCPTLLITADPDRGGIITPEAAQVILEMNSHFQLAHIPAVGHHVRFENYDAYMDSVKAFLKRI